jgi:hypothetical protein
VERDGVAAYLTDLAADLRRRSIARSRCCR